MALGRWGAAAALIAGLALAAPAAAEETPKRGGTLTYMIPADAPPSFDAHRESTFATVHAGAPFYSLLIRINPDNPASTTDFVCDLCTAMPQPTDSGKTYTFKIRPGVKFHDGSPLAATKEELQQLAGFWPDIEKSRAEARRLLKEAGQENLSFELLNRNVDQPYKFNGLWVIDEWSKIGVKVSQRVLQTGPFTEAVRSGEFEAFVDGDCQNIVNPLLDGTKYLPGSVSSNNYGNYEDPEAVAIYERMVRETDFAKQRALMRQFEKRVLDTEAHELFLLWRYRIVPHRSYVKGWKIGPSHYVNQDLATIWLDK